MFITPETPSIFLAFTGGLLTFLSPCIFPLIPGYLSFMSGETIENLKTGETDSKISPRLKAFLGALKDSNPKPEALYCYNGGVYLGVEEPYKTLLQELRDAGIKIFFCGTCVKFYELKDIKVEEQTNMLGIIEAMANASAVIRA